MTRLPINRFVKCGFYTPIGVKNVRLDGADVVGEWASMKSFYGERGSTVVERFANLTPTPRSIVEFTRRFGPLSLRAWDEDSDRFRFSISSWKSAQSNFRRSWTYVQNHGLDRAAPHELIRLEFGPKQLLIQCPDIKTFMELELESQAEKLRMCERKDCIHPYFIPQHGKERYCSTGCANWAQSQWKKRWHEEQREKRIKKEKRDGTQKAR
jgi:hypothetical protein